MPGMWRDRENAWRVDQPALSEFSRSPRFPAQGARPAVSPALLFSTERPRSLDDVDGDWGRTGCDSTGYEEKGGRGARRGGAQAGGFAFVQMGGPGEPRPG